MMEADDTPLHWRENTRDPATRLPLCLYPFRIVPAYNRDDERTGEWALEKERSKGGAEEVSRHPDQWLAFAAMFAAYKKWFPTRPIDRVYFIGARLAKGELVKVGYSNQPEARLRNLQTASARRLEIFATTPGDRTLEAKYHSRWRLRRQQGEWFIIGDAILAEIARLKAEAEV